MSAKGSAHREVARHVIRSGVVILESDDAAAVQRFIGRWNSHMDIDLAPVLEDEETAAVAKQILADHEAR